MSNHIFVCPFDEGLIRRLKNKRLVVSTSAFEHIHHICRLVNDSESNLHCLIIEHKGALASVPFHESWRGIPIALFANEIGPFKEVMGKLHLIRDMNMRIFLNSDKKENFTALHILASLGIDCGIYFGKKEIDWEAMNDLMTYSVYGKVNHATIEPFRYAVSNYSPERLTDFSSVYFNNPMQYLHIDKDENIALTADDLKNGKFITQKSDTLPQVLNDPKFDDAVHSWQDFFLKPDGCAYCQAWRVCMGKFSDTAEKNPGCRKFFTDLMDASDHFLAMQHQNRRKELWQP